MRPAPEGVRVYAMEEDWEVLVGRTARDNEVVSLQLGRPGDFWFHVAGMPGSHVLARHPDQPDQLPREVKRVAAGLAAFYSKGRAAARVAVHWTTCKHVSKRRGSPAGQVQLRRFQALTVAPLDPDAYFGGNA